ncbi:MAG: hypothetical protein FJ286_13070 [Planctomycetes bacterium]|nr:hypothetical protein [Planctomycetota bacterium]
MKPAPSRARPPRGRPGISLLEVLISMGILTVGLLSVLALVPAGKSQAVKATIYDRSAVMASNVAADLIARGLLRTSSWKTGKGNAPIAVFDPLYSGPNTLPPPADTLSWPPVMSSGSTTSIALLVDAATTGTSAAWLYSLDNVAPDDPPLPQWSVSLANAAPAGRRAFEGLYSFLATVQTSATASPFWEAATPATLTIVTFQRRDPTAAPVVLLPDTANDIWTYTAAALPSGQTIKDVIRPGSLVLWLDNAAKPTAARWYRVVLAAEQQPGSVALTCEGGDPDSSNTYSRVFLFPGAVGGIELPVKLEGTSVWNR